MMMAFQVFSWSGKITHICVQTVLALVFSSADPRRQKKGRERGKSSWGAGRLFDFFIRRCSARHQSFESACARRRALVTAASNGGQKEIEQQFHVGLPRSRAEEGLSRLRPAFCMDDAGAPNHAPLGCRL